LSDSPPVRRVQPVRPLSTSALWIGGLLTATAAAVVALTGNFLGCLVFCGVARSTAWCGAAVLAALLATGVMQLLLWYTVRPFKAFWYLIVLSTLLAVILPFAEGGSWGPQPTQDGVIIAVGGTIGLLVVSAARGAVRLAALTPDADVAGPGHRR
jgi:hypothetical protein